MLMHFPVLEDFRGCLLPLEWAQLPFWPVRAFVVTAPAPDGAVRGGHAHRSGSQLLVRVAGTIEVEAKYGGGTAQVNLDAKSNAVLIMTPVWARQTYRGRNATLLVLAEEPYDQASYLHDIPT